MHEANHVECKLLTFHQVEDLIGAAKAPYSHIEHEQEKKYTSNKKIKKKKYVLGLKFRKRRKNRYIKTLNNIAQTLERSASLKKITQQND